MKKCDVCGFEGEWLSHYCPGPPGYPVIGGPDENGRVLVEVFPPSGQPYPGFVFDLDELRNRKFDLSK